MEIQVRILEEEDIARIHSRSVRLLSEVGVQMYYVEVCRLLRRQGVPVDDGLVRLPAAVVEEALRVAPRGFSL